jgi:hypothetical protein
MPDVDPVTSATFPRRLSIVDDELEMTHSSGGATFLLRGFCRRLESALSNCFVHAELTGMVSSNQNHF